MKRARLLLAAALIASLAPAGPAVSSPCRSQVITLRTLHIEAKPSKKKVRRGETFFVHVTVTRPAEEDPAGNGIEYERPTSVPAQNATVGVSIWVGENTYFWGVGKTDEDGKADVKLRVPKRSELGWALAAISARHWVKNDCPDIVEEGYRNYVDFVKIVP